MKLLRAGACLALALPATSVLAEVRQAAPDGFFLAFTQSTTVSPARAYAAVAALPRWWSDEHTWSGKAANLSLKAEAGGCFCERWADGSAEHGRVLMAIPGKLLRLETALGPLQEFALTGVLTFWVRYNEDGTARIDVEYRVNGSSASALDQWAPQVDDMLGAQFARLVRYIGTGDPEDHAKSGAADGDTPRGAAARAAVLEEWKQQIERDAAARKATAPASPAAAHPAAGGKP
ncbi:MAG: hypothetical protein KF903_04550 [Dokdonella sp.]|uniref:hypothetical protein n=1 Tax=Dokdonella sp. TaxID=2291710 RepID=UPI0025BA31BA|nr:hypothetical protein [Dokdonella sp.]MBX3700251.1 hypothetical protein [Dokdonella sp.]